VTAGSRNDTRTVEVRMRLTGLQRPLPAARWCAVLGAALIAAACHPSSPQASAAARPRPTPAPGFALPLDTSSHAALVAYAHSLTFDTTAPGVDRRYLVLGQGMHQLVGPFVELAPEIGAAAIDHADLVRGRILARLTVDGSHPLMGSAAGVAYLWVDSVGSSFRTVVVPESLGAPMRVSPVSLGAYGPAGAPCRTLAVARFWTDRLVPPNPAPGAKEQVFRSSRGIVCYPCNSTICCSDTTSSNFGP